MLAQMERMAEIHNLFYDFTREARLLVIPPFLLSHNVLLGELPAAPKLEAACFR
jgi:hypothetical protein